jgi:flagellar export protein FliJ
VKTVWSALLAKAERGTREAQIRLADVSRRRQSAAEQEHKVDALLLDYNQQLASVQQRSHHSSEVNNYRHFIVQLQELKNRSKYQQQRLEIEWHETRQRLVAAERERIKVEHLATRAREKLQREADAFEVRSNDSQAIAQHNFRARIST